MAKAKKAAGKNKVREGITDFHLHIQPFHMLRTDVLAILKGHRTDADLMDEFVRHPTKFLKYLDQSGVHRACLINYVSPDVMGFPFEVNDWISRYCSEDPERLIAVGSVHPRLSTNPSDEMDRLCGDLGVRMIKIHPAHQLVYPNEYRSGLHSLGVIYRKAQEYRVPVMIHTGTSIFPGARNKYANPMECDDIGVDFPDLHVVLAHGGRPIWMEEAFFLVRRHRNFFMDVSGIPPKALLEYFPKLESVADKVLFGTDWPAPKVPSVRENIDAFEKLPLSEAAKQKILVENSKLLIP